MRDEQEDIDSDSGKALQSLSQSFDHEHRWLSGNLAVSARLTTNCTIGSGSGEPGHFALVSIEKTQSEAAKRAVATSAYNAHSPP